jgi:hypothetical protein
MSIRFNLGNQRASLETIYKWMNQNIGLIEEDKTWFWDTDIYQEWCDNSQQIVDRHREGIRIWKDCPAISLAIINWS